MILRERARVPLAHADHLRHVPGEIHHRGRLRAAGPAVDDQIQLVLEPVPDEFRVGQGRVLTGEDQGRRHHGRPQFLEQGLGHGVIGYTQTDRLALGVPEPPRHFAGGGQQERVGSRRGRLEQAVDGRAEVRVDAQLREIAQEQREPVPGIDVTDPADPLQPGRVRHRRAQRVARVGGVGDDAAPVHHPRGLADQPRLRGLGMDPEKLAHPGMVTVPRPVSPRNHRNDLIVHDLEHLYFAAVIA